MVTLLSYAVCSVSSGVTFTGPGGPPIKVNICSISWNYPWKSPQILIGASTSSRFGSLLKIPWASLMSHFIESIGGFINAVVFFNIGEFCP